jgi:hypothetical protein
MNDPSASFSRARLESALNSSFAVAPIDGQVPPHSLQLVEIKSRPAPPGYEQFSALFIGPAEPILAQGTYGFHHGTLGEFALFMVPVGRAGSGIQYEVCISRATGEGAPDNG